MLCVLLFFCVSVVLLGTCGPCLASLLFVDVEFRNWNFTDEKWQSNEHTGEVAVTEPIHGRDRNRDA